MEWNDPSNFQFVICLLKRNAKRMQKVHLILTYQLNQIYQNSGDDGFVFGDGWLRQFAFTFKGWNTARVPAADAPEAEVAGPLLQFIPGGGLFDLNATQSYHPLDYNFMTELIDAKKIPAETTVSDLVTSLDAQTTTTIANDFLRSDGAFGEYYRQEFVDFINANKKLAYESDPMINPPTGFQLAWGRLPPIYNPGINDLAYVPRVNWIEPTAEGYKAWNLPCKGGCCCCCC